MKRLKTARLLVALWVAVAGVACASKTPSASTQGARPQVPAERGPQLQGPEFDRRGADFTRWLDDFEKKVHYNWKPPTYFGYGGRVAFRFVVERNGSILTMEMLESSGTEVAMDSAAREALSRSKFDPLPADFDAARVDMQITFHYNPPPGE